MRLGCTKYPIILSARVGMSLLSSCTVAQSPCYQCHTRSPPYSFLLTKELPELLHKVFLPSSQSNSLSTPRLAKLCKQGLFADIRDICQFKYQALFAYNWRFYLREMRNLSNPSTLKKNSQSCQTLLIFSFLDYPFLSLEFTAFHQGR